MSKKKGKREIAEESSSTLIVDDPAPIVKSCVKRIGDILGAKGLRFAEYKTPEGNSWELRGSFDCTAYDKRRNRYYSVIPLDPSSILKEEKSLQTPLGDPSLQAKRHENVFFRKKCGSWVRTAFPLDNTGPYKCWARFTYKTPWADLSTFLALTGRPKRQRISSPATIPFASLAKVR